jgi:hypothetical protein
MITTSPVLRRLVSLLRGSIPLFLLILLVACQEKRPTVIKTPWGTTIATDAVDTVATQEGQGSDTEKHQALSLEDIKANGEMIGNRTRAKVVKNKVAPPFREAEFDIMYGEGISKISEIIDLAVKLDIIEKGGAWFTVNGQRLQGKDAVKEYLTANPEICDKIEQDIRDNSFKLLSPQAQRAARVSGRAVEVSAADFDEG